MPFSLTNRIVGFRNGNTALDITGILTGISISRSAELLSYRVYETGHALRVPSGQNDATVDLAGAIYRNNALANDVSAGLQNTSGFILGIFNPSGRVMFLNVAGSEENEVADGIVRIDGTAVNRRDSYVGYQYPITIGSWKTGITKAIADAAFANGVALFVRKRGSITGITIDVRNGTRQRTARLTSIDGLRLNRLTFGNASNNGGAAAIRVQRSGSGGSFLVGLLTGGI